MGLFSKKYCNICGDAIPFRGNKKLKDGNCCINCVEKLSPFFTNVENATVEQIKHQVHCRNENLKQYKNFTPTKILGNENQLLIDENKCQFAIKHYNQKNSSNLDIFDSTNICSCNIDIVEFCEEIRYKDSNDNIKSFSPKCFAYSYDFYVKINVNIPYINIVNFKVNRKRINNGTKTLIVMQGGILNRVADALMTKSYNGNISNADEVKSCLEYIKYDRLATEIRDALLSLKNPHIYNPNAQIKVTCPWCGTKVIGDKYNHCPCCCGSLDA